MFKLTHQVNFYETDMAGVVHFSNYYRLMEQAEHAFFRTLDLAAHDPSVPQRFAWLRVHSSCNYRRPLRYPDKIEIEMRIGKLGRTSVTYQFDFQLLGDTNEGPVAQGQVIVAHAERNSEADPWASTPIPPDVRRKLEAFL